MGICGRIDRVGRTLKPNSASEEHWAQGRVANRKHDRQQTCTLAHFAIPPPGAALSANDQFCSAALHSLVFAPWRSHRVPTRSPPGAALPSHSRACRQIARDNPRRRAIQERSTLTRAALRQQPRKATPRRACSRCRRPPTRPASRSREWVPSGSFIGPRP